MVRERGFKLSRYGNSTLTLPYAGAIRIRFKGLPSRWPGSQSTSGRHP